VRYSNPAKGADCDVGVKRIRQYARERGERGREGERERKREMVARGEARRESDRQRTIRWQRRN